MSRPLSITPTIMGHEASATLVRGRSRIAGRALLEGDHLLFRGDGVREKVPFTTVTGAEAKGTTLQLEHAAGVLQLVLEPGVAEVWVPRIRNPKSRIDKLGVKAGMKVVVLGVDDATLRDEIVVRGATVAARLTSGCDLIFLGAESSADLARLQALRARLTPAGAIWVVHRKGKGATLKDVEVFAAAKAAGLVDNKVASFSETHTAERLVIPLASRPRR